MSTNTRPVKGVVPEPERQDDCRSLRLNCSQSIGGAQKEACRSRAEGCADENQQDHTTAAAVIARNVKAEKLVCRYCGSDDLTPSFEGQHDARCRASFKKRYGSTSRGNQNSPAGKAKSGKVVKAQNAEFVEEFGPHPYESQQRQSNAGEHPAAARNTRRQR